MDPSSTPSSPSLSWSIVIALLVLCIGTHLLERTHFFLPPSELLWNGLVYCTPAHILLDPRRRRELEATNMISQMHAAKSEAMRRMLGRGGSTVFSHLSAARGDSDDDDDDENATETPRPVTSNAPCGLGNWDNSCYQNSVLQALSTLPSLGNWLRKTGDGDATEDTTNGSLQELTAQLRDPANNGTHVWTPAKLKNMSSWQQQDAQEYFSKIMDDLDKEAAKSLAGMEVKVGLEGLTRDKYDEKQATELVAAALAIGRNPLEGLTAQKITCTRCGFSEGYSMTPFTCLTVPLGSGDAYDLEECLDQCTESERISGVECGRCTLLNAEEQLKKYQSAHSSPTLELPPEVRRHVAERLALMEEALANDNFSDKFLKETFKISPKNFVSSTKVREVVLARAPEVCVLHINRSVFDMFTGVQRKNHAYVRYPSVLNLRPWMLDISGSDALYRLKAVVTHYGRHENGHYYCFRKHPVAIADDDDICTGKERWWCLSDKSVSPATEEDVLEQGGAFMLFYEREALPSLSDLDMQEAINVQLPDLMDDESTDLSGGSTLPSIGSPSSHSSYSQDAEMWMEPSLVPKAVTPPLPDFAEVDAAQDRPDSTFASTELLPKGSDLGTINPMARAVLDQQVHPTMAPEQVEHIEHTRPSSQSESETDSEQVKAPATPTSPLPQQTPVMRTASPHLTRRGHGHGHDVGISRPLMRV